MSQESRPTPAMADESPTPARIRRNTACVRCRDAKVKCNASLDPNRPCLRCSKSGLPCVFDRSHKRISGRSKLEELAAELRSIKEAVSPRVLDAPTGVPPLRPEHSNRPRHPSQSFNNPIPAINVSNSTTSFGAPGHGNIAQYQTPSPTTYTTPPPPRGLPAEPRALRSKVLSSEDIDYYFTKYFDHFHPYLPLVRTRDPNACYESGPILFWVIIVTACRRYSKDDDLFCFLVDSVASEIWAVAAQPPLRLPTINALLILAAWPLPGIRFMSDPSTLFTGMALNSCLAIGLQTGKGYRPELAHSTYQLSTTDEEATFTWATCNLLSQRISSYLGCLSTASLSGKLIDMILDGTTPCSVPRSFVLNLETARFSNRFNKLVAACLDEAPGVSHHVVAQMEEEFTHLQKFLYPNSADLNLDSDNFTVLLTLLDLQIHYLTPLPGLAEETFKRNLLRCYNTAQSVIKLASKLQCETEYLSHAPHFIFRALLAASCVCLSFHVSPYAASLEDDSGESLINDALAAMRACSIQEGDLPTRVANVMETCWGSRHRSAITEDWGFGSSSFSHRLGASITFHCLRKWKAQMDKMHNGKSNEPAQEVGLREDSRTTVPGNEEGLNDAIQQIDWNAFMDDFDWSFASNYLTVPQGLQQ